MSSTTNKWKNEESGMIVEAAAETTLLPPWSKVDVEAEKAEAEKAEAEKAEAEKAEAEKAPAKAPAKASK